MYEKEKKIRNKGRKDLTQRNEIYDKICRIINSENSCQAHLSQHIF
jgi:hypothetical protein